MINQCPNQNSFLGQILNETIHYLLGFNCANDMGEGFAILITFSVAIITGTIAYYMTLRRDAINIRNTNTDRFLIHNDERLINSLISFGSKIASQEKDALTHTEVNNKIKDWNIIFAHLEKLAVAIKFGFVSEKYILSVERSIILRCFQSCQKIISDNRHNTNNYYYLRNYQSLYFRTLLRNKFIWRLFLTVEHIFIIHNKFIITDILLNIEYFFIRFHFSAPKEIIDVDFRDLKKFRKLSYRRNLFIIILSIIIEITLNVVLI